MKLIQKFSDNKKFNIKIFLRYTDEESQNTYHLFLMYIWIYSPAPYQRILIQRQISQSRLEKYSCTSILINFLASVLLFFLFQNIPEILCLFISFDIISLTYQLKCYFRNKTKFRMIGDQSVVNVPVGESCNNLTLS